MKMISSIWTRLVRTFEPIQYFFNGNFWKVFVDKFGRFTGKNVLDIACGTGEILRYINPSGYLGIDINPYYIEFAQKRF